MLALEMHKPLAGITAHAAVAFSPFFAPFIGFDKTSDYTQLFSKRENWDKLVDIIEATASERKAGNQS